MNRSCISRRRESPFFSHIDILHYGHRHSPSDPHTSRIHICISVEAFCRIHRPPRPCYLLVLLCELALLTLRTLNLHLQDLSHTRELPKFLCRLRLRRAPPVPISPPTGVDISLAQTTPSISRGRHRSRFISLLATPSSRGRFRSRAQTPVVDLGPTSSLSLATSPYAVDFRPATQQAPRG